MAGVPELLGPPLFGPVTDAVGSAVVTLGPCVLVTELVEVVPGLGVLTSWSASLGPCCFGSCSRCGTA